MKEATPKLQVKVFSPYETYYEGEATSVSAVDKTGPFDILANHANFLALLVKGEVKIAAVTGERKIPIERGLIKVSNNTVVLFANV